MSRPRHPDKHIEKAVQYAERLSWRVVLSKGHPWGRILCPHAERGGCMVGIWSTPRNTENHARHIMREVDMCPHKKADQEKTVQEKDDQGKEAADE